MDDLLYLLSHSYHKSNGSNSTALWSSNCYQTTGADILFHLKQTSSEDIFRFYLLIAKRSHLLVTNSSTLFICSFNHVQLRMDTLEGSSATASTSLRTSVCLSFQGTSAVHISCKLLVYLQLHLPCSPHRSSLHSDNQMTCPGTQSTAYKHEEEEAAKESLAPSPPNWCSGSPRLRKKHRMEKQLSTLMNSEHLVYIYS